MRYITMPCRGNREPFVLDPPTHLRRIHTDATRRRTLRAARRASRKGRCTADVSLPVDMVYWLMRNHKDVRCRRCLLLHDTHGDHATPLMFSRLRDYLAPGPFDL